MGQSKTEQGSESTTQKSTSSAVSILDVSDERGVDGPAATITITVAITATITVAITVAITIAVSCIPQVPGVALLHHQPRRPRVPHQLRYHLLQVE